MDISAVDNRSKKVVAAKTLLGADAPSRARNAVRAGDVIIATTRPNLNAVACIPLELDESVCSTGFCVLRPSKCVDADFLFYTVQTPAFVEALTELARGANYPAVSDKQVLSQPVELPDLPTQRRLATHLKSQMTAVEETRRRVEEQAKAAASLPTRLLKEIFQEDETNEWPVRSVGDACDFLPARSINLKGTAAVRAVTTACLQETGFTESGVKDALMMEDDVADARISSGEIMIARSNTPALVGRVALFEGSKQPLVASDLTIRLRARDGVVPAYAAAWFSYLFVTGYWQERASGASDTMKKIGRAQLAATDIPIPPLKTQRQIAARLREQFTHLQQLQKALGTQLEALDKLPGAFLREAFGSL
ncbi:MAG: restriction endonuclease subunit S [Verrucomicrobiaceae bacterium]|nr:restriction endonuclease subunit S [Verrucomicrobiaceae bacterium]